MSNVLLREQQIPPCSPISKMGIGSKSNKMQAPKTQVDDQIRFLAILLS